MTASRQFRTVAPSDADGPTPRVPKFRVRPHRFTVDEHHRLLDTNVLHPALRTELIGGSVIEKGTCTPRHDSTLMRAFEVIRSHVSPGWELRVKMGISMDNAEPEADIAVVRGPVDRFCERHPRATEVELVIEVADATLSYERGRKFREYARNGIQCFWIINLISQCVEEYTQPSGPGMRPTFRSRRIYRKGESVPLKVAGKSRMPVQVDQLILSTARTHPRPLKRTLR